MPAGSLPVLVFFLGAAVFEGYCLVDCARSTRVRYFNQWTWALIMLITIPLGGVLYLVYGKER